MFLRASAEVTSVREAAVIRRNWDDWPHCSECHYVNEDLVIADKGYDGCGTTRCSVIILLSHTDLSKTLYIINQLSHWQINIFL